MSDKSYENTSIVRIKHLFAYMLFIAFCLIYVVNRSAKDDVTAAVVFAVSVASLFLSVSDLYETFAEGDRSERIWNEYRVLICGWREQIYSDRLEKKYHSEAEEYIKNLSDEELAELDKKAELSQHAEEKEEHEYREALSSDYSG